MFSIEVLFKRINLILTNPTTEKGYQKLVKHVLNELNITSQDNEHYRILYFPAMIRNAIHMNGKHTDNDDNGNVAGIMFKFVRDQSLQYSSWRHLYFFSDKMLDTVRFVLENNMIKGKPIPTTSPRPRTY